MDNSGKTPLQAPGFNDVPLTSEMSPEYRFTHGINEFAQIPAITARELAMTAAMNTITDKPEWWRDIYNEQVLLAWKQEIFDHYPLLSPKAWTWLLAELRDKALEYRVKTFVRVLDTGTCVCKSDAISKTVKEKLKDSLGSLLGKASSIQERVIVDPQVHPLIFGESHVLQYGGFVPLDYDNPDSMLSLGETTTSKRQKVLAVDPEEIARIQEAHRDDRRKAHYNTGRENIETDPYWWSSTYQCLPCDIEFVQDRPQIASYINNLHPSHQSAYQAIEEITSASIKMWDECLIKGMAGSKRGVVGTERDNVYRFRHQTQRGRYPLRIITYGVEWQEQLPQWARCLSSEHADDFEEYAWAADHLQSGKQKTPKMTRACVQLNSNPHMEGVPPMQEPSNETWQLAAEYLGTDTAGWSRAALEDTVLAEVSNRRHWLHPEPGTAFTYEDWKTGKDVHKAIVKMVKQPRSYGADDMDPCDEPTHQRYSIDLAKSFKKTGLQIIVKVDEINLRPGEEHSGEWQLDGHLNEHVVGRACYVFDASNTDCSISFCQETPMYARAYRYAGNMQPMCETDDPAEWRYDNLDFDDELEAVAQVFGFESGDILMSGEMLYNTELPVQETGTVRLTEGRLITFPNVFEYRIKAVPVESTLPSHVRLVWLQLIDPNYRLCSTRNVPPQQSEWWAALVVKLLVKKGLPTELASQIVQDYDYPMSRDVAEQHKRRMEEEQSWIQVARHADMTLFHFPYPAEF